MNLKKLLKTATKVAEVAVPAYMLYKANKEQIDPLARKVLGKKRKA